MGFAKTKHFESMYWVGIALLVVHVLSGAISANGFSVYGLVLLTPLLLASQSIQWWVPIAYAILIDAFRFRTHYLQHATSGFYNDKAIEEFLQHGKTPIQPSLGDTFRGLIDAFNSYATYNFAGRRAAGLFQSPVGGPGIRCFRILSLPLVTIMLCPFLASELRNGWPRWEFVCLMLVFPLLVWIAASCCSILAIAASAFAFKSCQMHPMLWQQLKDRLSTSLETLEASSIYLGSVAFDGAPILYPVVGRYPHMRLTGPAQQGKTTYLLSLLDQIINRGDTSILYVDLSAPNFGPLAAIKMFASQSQAMGKRPIPIKHFSIDVGSETFVFDLFTQPWWIAAGIPQKAAFLLSIWSILYCRASGNSFYSDAAYHVTQFVLKRNPNVTSWTELENAFHDAFRYAKPHEISINAKNDASQVLFVAARLAQIESLNSSPSWSNQVKANAISFEELLTKPSVVFASLSQMRQPLLSGEIGRLLISSVMYAAGTLHQTQRKTEVVIVLDGWQTMVADALDVLLTQAKALGIGVILCNENVSQLKNGGMDLTCVVQGHATVQCWFQVNDLAGANELNRLGGKYRRWAISYTTDPNGNTRVANRREVIDDRVDQNLIAEVGSDRTRFFMRITKNHGYAAFDDLIFVARMTYMISNEDYNNMCNSRWPRGTLGTISNAYALPKSQVPQPFGPPHNPTNNSRKKQPKTP